MAVIKTEKEVITHINNINNQLLTAVSFVSDSLGTVSGNLVGLLNSSTAASSDVTAAISSLIDDAPTQEQKTQLSGLLSMYNSALDAANTVSRLLGNMTSTVTSITSSISKSNTTLMMQSEINMPNL